MFKRKVYKDLLEWKKEYCPRYACLLEGARRVGNSTNRSYRVSNPSVSLSQTMEIDNFKLYISDIGLFTTMLFNDSEHGRVDIYKKLLGDNLPADLGYMYENVVAQILVSKGRALYYHTWDKDK